MTAIPTSPIHRDPIEVYSRVPLPEVRALLDQALDGIELGAYDVRIVDWLKGQDQPTIVTLASLILRARQSPPS